MKKDVQRIQKKIFLILTGRFFKIFKLLLS